MTGRDVRTAHEFLLPVSLCKDSNDRKRSFFLNPEAKPMHLQLFVLLKEDVLGLFSF